VCRSAPGPTRTRTGEPSGVSHQVVVGTTSGRLSWCGRPGRRTARTAPPNRRTVRGGL